MNGNHNCNYLWRNELEIYESMIICLDSAQDGGKFIKYTFTNGMECLFLLVAGARGSVYTLGGANRVRNVSSLIIVSQSVPKYFLVKRNQTGADRRRKAPASRRRKGRNWQKRKQMINKMKERHLRENDDCITIINMKDLFYDYVYERWLINS